MRYLLVCTVFLGLSLAACSTKHALSPTDAVTVTGVMRISGTELVEKKTKWNVRTEIQSLSDKSTIVMLQEMQCFRGEQQGVVEHSFAGIGERTINFMPNQLKRFNFLCDFGGREVTAGAFKLVIPNVYENPNGDARTLGKVVKKNLVWVIGGK